MASKDYYQILDVPPTASLEDIKKAYRRLALQYHPDTSQNEGFDVEKFREIQEANEVLSNTKRRQEYHYKRFNKTYRQQEITPQAILQQTAELEKLVAVLDPHRIDYDQLAQHITLTLNSIALRVLQQLNDGVLKRAVVRNVLCCTLVLPYGYIVPIHNKLVGIANSDPLLVQQINNQTSRQKRHFYYDRYKLLAALLVAVLLCVLFYFLG